MPKQFIRIYALLILTIIGLLIGAGALFEAVMEPRNSYQISISQIFEHVKKSPDAALVQVINPDQIRFPSRLEEKLRLGEVVPVQLNTKQVIYYKLEEGKLHAFGPVADDSNFWQQANRTFAWLFYTCLAIVLLILLYPVGRDILKVQQSALQFSRKPQKLNIPIRPGSSVYPLANTLEYMSGRIVDLLEMQRDLSNTVAHEIRTPLSRMEFIIESIGSNIQAKHRIRLQKDIEEINLLATDYLEFARSQHQEPILNIERLDKEVLIQRLEPKFTIYRSQVIIQIKTDKQYCHYDVNLLEVAAQNLLMNALRFANTRIELNWHSSDGLNYLTVSDDGVGLKGKQSALKKAFKRGRNNPKDLGFGLGLYIVNQIACRHGGELNIDEDPELGGARFQISWPERP